MESVSRLWSSFIYHSTKGVGIFIMAAEKIYLAVRFSCHFNRLLVSDIVNYTNNNASEEGGGGGGECQSSIHLMSGSFTLGAKRVNGITPTRSETSRTTELNILAAFRGLVLSNTFLMN